MEGSWTMESVCVNAYLNVYPLNGVFQRIRWHKIFVVIRVRTITSYVRDNGATTVPARHMWETGSLNWVQFVLQWFIRFLKFAEITEFNESSTPFRKNSNDLRSAIPGDAPSMKIIKWTEIWSIIPNFNNNGSSNIKHFIVGFVRVIICHMNKVGSLKTNGDFIVL